MVSLQRTDPRVAANRSSMKTGDEKVALRVQGGLAANGLAIWRVGKALTFGTRGAVVAGDGLPAGPLWRAGPALCRCRTGERLASVFSASYTKPLLWLPCLNGSLITFNAWIWYCTA